MYLLAKIKKRRREPVGKVVRLFDLNIQISISGGREPKTLNKREK
jgi:hypothetical protein